ncbi:hypothetical protein ACROYT_G015606 [Oculina patagonica]
MEKQLLNLLNNNMNSLKANIHRRFDDALPVVSAFSIFDPLALPNPGSPGFTDYGKREVVILAKHFYSGNPKEHRLIAEWEKFKYDLASWKPTIPEETVQQEQENLEPGQLLDAPSPDAVPSTIADEVTVATTALHLAADTLFDEGIYSESEDSEEEDMFI